MRVMHFDIPAEDPKRAEEFFKKAFGWSFNKWDGPMDYWLVTTGEGGYGIDGGMSGGKKPGDHVINTIGVDDIKAAQKSIEEAGGKIVVPIMPVPGVGWLLYFDDTEGNRWGVMEDDSEAK